MLFIFCRKCMRDDDYVDGDDVDDVDDVDDGDDVDDVDDVDDDDDDDDGVLQGTPSLKGQFVPHALPMSPAGSDKDQRPDCQSHHLGWQASKYAPWLGECGWPDGTQGYPV